MMNEIPHWYFVRMVVKVPTCDPYKSTKDYETGHTILSAPSELEDKIYEKYGNQTRILAITKID